MGLRAPTGSNNQNWEFVVVKDRKVKAQLAARYREAWSVYGDLARRGAGGDEPMVRQIRAVQWQVDHVAEIPVLVVPCLRAGVREGHLAYRPSAHWVAASFYGSIFPSVQNLLLAARAMGLGASLTTLPLWSVTSARRILGLPLSVTPCCVVPLGLAAWPRGRPPAKRLSRWCISTGMATERGCPPDASDWEHAPSSRRVMSLRREQGGAGAPGS